MLLLPTQTSMNFRYAIIVLIACLLFFPFLGHVHLFDWDEINFAECAREMIVSKDYLRAQIDFMPFWEKPPLFIWLQVAAMKIFGIGAYAARFPNALTGVITLVTIFYIGKRVANEKMATWWVLLYAFFSAENIARFAVRNFFRPGSTYKRPGGYFSGSNRICNLHHCQSRTEWI